MPGVHVESLQALADLERALARFAEACQDKLPEVRREAERRLAVLESVCREREREVENWRESYGQADEDEDTGYLAYRMEQAQDALHQARHWQRRCEESCHAYARQARQLESFTERDIAQARDFLRRKIAEIQEYQGVSLGGAVSSSGPIANAAPATAEENLARQQARELLRAAEQIEPTVTADLQRIVGLLGGTLAELECRLKSEDSLTRKLFDRSKERPGLPFRNSLSKQSRKINDALRYTVIWQEAEYAAKCCELSALMETQGYQPVKPRNAWLTAGREDDKGYRGVNQTFYWQEQMLEVQYHTLESWRVKNLLHPLYEEVRNPVVAVDRRKELLQRQRDEAGKISVPPDIDKIRSTRH